MKLYKQKLWMYLEIFLDMRNNRGRMTEVTDNAEEYLDFRWRKYVRNSQIWQISDGSIANHLARSTVLW